MSLLLLIAAIIVFVADALIAHGDIVSDQFNTWLAIGLLLLAASQLPFERWSK